MAKTNSYLNFYFKDLLFFTDVPKGTSQVLEALYKRCITTENGMVVYISVGMKKEIAKDLGYKNLISVTNAISKFSENNVLKKLDTGVYLLNPEVFGMEPIKENEKITLSLIYQNGKRLISTTREKIAEEESVAAMSSDTDIKKV